MSTLRLISYYHKCHLSMHGNFYKDKEHFLMLGNECLNPIYPTRILRMAFEYCGPQNNKQN